PTDQRDATEGKVVMDRHGVEGVAPTGAPVREVELAGDLGLESAQRADGDPYLRPHARADERGSGAWGLGRRAAARQDERQRHRYDEEHGRQARLGVTACGVVQVRFAPKVQPGRWDETGVERRRDERALRVCGTSEPRSA